MLPLTDKSPDAVIFVKVCNELENIPLGNCAELDITFSVFNFVFTAASVYPTFASFVVTLVEKELLAA